MSKLQSKIEKLISELCPNGVEFKKIEQVCEINRGRVMSKDYLRDNVGTYPVYSSQTFNSGIFGLINTFDYDGEYVTWTTDGANAGSVFYRNGKFSITNVCGLLKPKTKELDTKYLLYILGVTAKSYVNAGMGNPKLMSNVMAGIKIPVPPLAIQEEIVKILNSFTGLEAELEAELEARKKQYEHYRSKLLTFDDMGGVQWIPISNIGKVSMCKRIFKNETSITGDIPFYKIGTFGKSPDAFISKAVFDEYKNKFSFPKKGDILLSASGTIGRRVVYNGEPAYFQDSNIIWLEHDETKVLNRYLYHFYATVKWQTEGGTIQRLYNDNFKKINVPVPSLGEQEKIASILDNFEALTNDTSIGLPAELKARRSQYEYYRNKLLTFPELKTFDKVKK
ncbi:MAG TPA: restriction endonuclease subunit S [Saprospiraceae bacterium]|nr:restriction endonuclease subunit S [Saprospiraceae bacterium]